MSSQRNKMTNIKERECLLCKSHDGVVKFYYGFWKVEYEPHKWCFLCKDCALTFLKLSSYCDVTRKKEPLKDFEREIVNERMK